MKYIRLLIMASLILIFSMIGISTPPPCFAATLTSVSVTPENPVLTVGQTQQFTATALYNDASSKVIGTAISAIAAGWDHTCAILANGTVRCWGKNGYGQLGDGTITDSSTPVVVSGISNAVALTAGASYTCAVLADGRHYAGGLTRLVSSEMGRLQIPQPRLLLATSAMP